MTEKLSKNQSNRRRLLQAMGYVYGKVALPMPLPVLAGGIGELTDDMYDIFSEDPRNKPIIEWLDILDEMASNQQYTKACIGSCSAAKGLTQYNIRDIADLIHNSVADDLYYTQHLAAESSALMRLKPTLAEIQACLEHPLMQSYGPELLVEGSIEETANLLLQMSQATESQMQAFIGRLMARNASVDQGLFELAKKFPAIQEEVDVLNKFHRGRQDNQSQHNANSTKASGHFPSFATKYLENSFPIPHDYYAKPKADSWAERAVSKPTTEDRSL